MCGEHPMHPTGTETDTTIDPATAGTATAPGRPRSSGPRTPAEVREAVRYALEGARRARGRDPVGDDEAVGDALLVASELTTNAMLHGGGVTAFEVSLVGRDVRLSVSDHSKEVPRPVRRANELGPLVIGGHGWPIVCRLARDIVISDLRTGGKRITAVVSLAPR
jgi:anti-sigma regulatory factor (Ser/Thr protein kinase)